MMLSPQQPSESEVFFFGPKDDEALQVTNLDASVCRQLVYQAFGAVTPGQQAAMVQELTKAVEAAKREKASSSLAAKAA